MIQLSLCGCKIMLRIKFLDNICIFQVKQLKLTVINKFLNKLQKMMFLTSYYICIVNCINFIILLDFIHYQSKLFCPECIKPTLPLSVQNIRCSSMFILMEFLIHIDTTQMELSVLYFKRVHVNKSKKKMMPFCLWRFFLS